MTGTLTETRKLLQRGREGKYRRSGRMEKTDMRAEPYLECRAASPTAHVTNLRAELSGVGQNMDRGPRRGVEMCREGRRSVGTRRRRAEKRGNMSEEGRVGVRGLRWCHGHDSVHQQPICDFCGKKPRTSWEDEAA